MAENTNQNELDEVSEFREMVETYTEWGILQAVIITGSLADAKDIVQDVFCKIWDKKCWDRNRNIKAYLATAIYNTAVNRYHTVRRHNSYAHTQNNTANCNHTTAEEAEAFEVLMNAIQTLDDVEQVIVKRRLKGHPYKDIVYDLNIPSATARKKLENAKNTLYNMLNNLKIVGHESPFYRQLLSKL